MNHPFYKNKKLLLIYISIWVVISITQMFVLYKQYDLSVWQSFADAVFYNTSFALIGISLWFLVRFAQSSKPGLFYVMVNHLTAATILILAWISGFKYILDSIFSDSLTYLMFSDLSAVWRAFFGVLMYSILVLIYFAEQYYTDLQKRIHNETVLKSAARDAELKMLKAQINPHFLFNSLNSISSLALTNGQKAHEMIIRLSDYFRYAITKSDNQFSNLKTELEQCKRYLEIEQIRFGSKLKIEFETDEMSLSCPLPAMILQPLYENAVKYGVYESLGEVSVYTSVSAKPDYVEIRIENDIEDMPKRRSGEGMGLKNVKERLSLSFNSDELLTIKQIPGKFIVLLKIPCKLEHHEN